MFQDNRDNLSSIFSVSTSLCTYKQFERKGLPSASLRLQQQVHGLLLKALDRAQDRHAAFCISGISERCQLAEKCYSRQLRPRLPDILKRTCPLQHSCIQAQLPRQITCCFRWALANAWMCALLIRPHVSGPSGQKFWYCVKCFAFREFSHKHVLVNNRIVFKPTFVHHSCNLIEGSAIADSWWNCLVGLEFKESVCYVRYLDGPTRSWLTLKMYLHMNVFLHYCWQIMGHLVHAVVFWPWCNTANCLMVLRMASSFFGQCWYCCIWIVVWAWICGRQQPPKWHPRRPCPRRAAVFGALVRMHMLLAMRLNILVCCVKEWRRFVWLWCIAS